MINNVPEWMSIAEAADWLDVSPQTIRNWVRQGIFRARRPNPPSGMIFVRVSDIKEALEEGEI